MQEHSVQKHGLGFLLHVSSASKHSTIELYISSALTAWFLVVKELCCRLVPCLSSSCMAVELPTLLSINITFMKCYIFINNFFLSGWIS